MNLYTITPRQAKARAYRARMAEEIMTGEAMNLEELKARRIEHPLITSYKNRIVGGNGQCEYEEWLDPLVRRFLPDTGSFARCLSLGAGMGRIESHLVQAGLCHGFDSVDLSTVGGSEFADLNFAWLPSGAYDLILCHGSLHHLINLEFVLGQINGALKPGGKLIVYEYTGERQWQFADHRMGFLKEHFPKVPFARPERWRINGFESVRSDELLGIIKAVFCRNTLFAASFGGVYFPFIACTAESDHDYLLPSAIEKDEYQSRFILGPCYHVGVYGKNPAFIHFPAEQWSDSMLARRLHRPFPIRERALNALRLSPAGPALRSLKRSFADPRHMNWGGLAARCVFAIAIILVATALGIQLFSP